MNQNTKQKRSAASWLAELAKGRYGEYALSVLTALLGVACSLIPYFIIIRLITALVNGTAELPRCLTLCAWMAGCWVLRYVLHSVSTSLSHHATFHVLANTRVRLLDKLATLPLGTVLDRSSGSYKNIIVERVDSIETTLAHLLPEMTTNIIGALAVLVLLGRFTSVGQWSGSEIMFFFGMMQMTFAITECVGRGLTAFSRVVQGGEFDQILLRPRNLLLQVLCSSTDPRRLSTAVLGIVLMWLSVTQLGIPWTLGSTVLLLISVAGTVLMLLGLFLVEATLCFLSVQSIEAVNILTYGGRTACEYPVDIYPRPIRLLFMYVAPFGLCMHVPVSALLHHPMVDWPAWTAYLAPLAGAMFFLLMALVWRKVGVKRYCSTGS